MNLESDYVLCRCSILAFLIFLFAFPLVVMSPELSLTHRWLSPLELAPHLFEGGSCHLRPMCLNFVLGLGCSEARTPASFPAASRYHRGADVTRTAPGPMSAVPHVGTLPWWSYDPRVPAGCCLKKLKVC